MKLETGYVQCYQGEGAGKTSASVGKIIRALNRGLLCCFIQFFKTPTSSEVRYLKKNTNVDVFSFFSKCKNHENHLVNKDFCANCFMENGDETEIAKKGLDVFSQCLGDYDLIVLDEIGFALFRKLITSDEFISILKKKPKHVEVILTGRGIPKEVLDVCDLVTHFECIRHYGKCRPGIEY